jgi:benzil reductase ((S)-benzoin forming)
MNYYIVTGSSKGLGKSLVELLLEDENNIVYGLSRTNTVTHKNYNSINIDLSQLDEVLNFSFPKIESAENIVLINNAGIVGDIKPIGRISNQQIIDGYTVNLVVPSILVNNFIANYSQLDCKKTVLNISSGAGRAPVDGWSVYCATKAGIDMFSQVLKEEANLNNSPVKILSLAPGVIDTEMQQEIRNTSQSDFSKVAYFKELKVVGMLAHPAFVAKQVLRFIKEDKLAENVLCSVRELTD